MGLHLVLMTHSRGSNSVTIQYNFAMNTISKVTKNPNTDNIRISRSSGIFNYKDYEHQSLNDSLQNHTEHIQEDILDLHVYLDFQTVPEEDVNKNMRDDLESQIRLREQMLFQSESHSAVMIE